jgi:membrane protein implicated in regulation of membrane protease activity
MKRLLPLVLFLLLGAAVIAAGILLGSNASWYFAWIFGTAFFVLLLAGAVIWFERQDAARSDAPSSSPASDRSL